MMSMARRPAARKRPAVNAAPRSAVVQSDKVARTGGGFTTLLESLAQEILAGTYWVDPAPHAGAHPVPGRVSRRRGGVKGRGPACDRCGPNGTSAEVSPGG